MKIIRNIIWMFLSAALLAGCVKEVEVSVEFGSSEYSMTVGGVLDLASEVVVSNTDAPVEFSSSDRSVAAVAKNGSVTALAPGETTITASVAGKSATAVVKVSAVVAQKIALTCPEEMLAGEGWVSVLAVVEPLDYDAENLEWTFTPTSDDLGLEYEKVSKGEYRLKVAIFKENASVTVMVRDRNSDLSRSGVIVVKQKEEEVIPAARIRLNCPSFLTESEKTWGVVTAEAFPVGYDMENLRWDFVPSDTELGFEYEKISAGTYNIRFRKYKEGGYVTVTVTDEVSEKFSESKIAVAQKPEEGAISISVSPDPLRILVGDQPVVLKVNTLPEVYDRSLFIWSSSNPDVATVSGGVVTPVAPGEVTIKTEDSIAPGASCECKVIVGTPVADADIRRVSLDRTSLNVKVGGDDVQLVATCYDESGMVVENYSGLVWEASSDANENDLEFAPVSVSSHGIITPLERGNSVVTVSVLSNRAVKMSCNVNVEAADVRVSEVRLPQSAIVPLNGSFRLEPVVLPDEALDKSLVYRSSNDKIVSVSEDGVVTGVSLGEAVITARASNGVKGECRIKVADAWVELSQTAMTMVKGEERTLSASVVPEEANDGSLKWTSSNPDVASVTDGVIKALAEGEAVIKAETASGIKGECNVTVKNAIEIILETENDQWDVYQFETLRIDVSYSDGYMPLESEWESSDPGKATVTVYDGYVIVEAVYEGFINGENAKEEVDIIHTVGKQSVSKTLSIRQARPQEVIFGNLPEGNTIHVGDKWDFGVKVLPEQASQDVAYWGDVQISSVANGSRAAYEPGVFVLAATASGTSVTKEIQVKVEPFYVTELVIPSELTMKKNSSSSLSCTYVSDGGDGVLPTYLDVTWNSSDPTIVSVDANTGEIKALAEGTATVTVTTAHAWSVPHGSPAVSASCTVTVEASEEGAKIGDYFYSDGTYGSSSSPSGKTVVGVVFSLANATVSDPLLMEDYPDCTHGLVVALQEYADQDMGYVSCYNGHGYFASAGFDAVSLVSTDKMNGYGNTAAHRIVNASRADYYKIASVADAHASAVASPSGASSWYVPSYKEMEALVENSATVNAALSAAGGNPLAEGFASEESYLAGYSSDWYWTSTVYGVWYAGGGTYDHFRYLYDIYNNGWTSSQQSSGNFKARVILAF